ncbi:prophenin and tritrpticin precursor-like isoform X3 [Manacus candei]|uniref:prophenin and tritrpticin precursor-like isoform X3 n=1 Tax=Manacus candei TaxID=415023 RepID=UPI00222744EE|nr:prophenin and tritrpticin precursor-like isoform X3 [Manacus candei]
MRSQQGPVVPHQPGQHNSGPDLDCGCSSGVRTAVSGQGCQDSGGSSSCRTVCGRGAMALALRLFLPLLLAVALHARAAQAAPVPARGADEGAEEDSPAAWTDYGLDILGPTGSPPTGKNQPPGEKKSQEAMELLDKMLSELERQREMDREAVLKAVVPKETNDSLPESPEGRKAMPGTSKPDVVGKAGTKDQKPPSVRRVLCPQDVRKHCMVGTVVVLFTVPLAMILCYVGIRWWIDSKEHPKHQPGLRRSPSPPESPRNVHLDTSRRGAQHQQPHRKLEPQPSVPPPRPPPVPQPRRQDLPDIPLPPPPPPPPPPPSLLT